MSILATLLSHERESLADFVRMAAPDRKRVLAAAIADPHASGPLIQAYRALDGSSGPLLTLTDQDAERAGKAIAALLGMRGDHCDAEGCVRFATAVGDKTHAGLARTVLRAILNPEHFV